MTFVLWVKKYWQWLLGGVVALASFVVGVVLKKRPLIVNGADPERARAESEVLLQRKKFEADALEEKAGAYEDHDTDVDIVVRAEEQKTQAIVDDVDKTNEYLQDVGKQVRGK